LIIESGITRKNAEVEICVLINSFCYFLECVFVHYGDNSYYLSVVHDKRVVIHKKYPSLRGAKIAFTRYFKARSYSDCIRAQWTHLFPTEGSWVQEKLDKRHIAIDDKVYT
jgi:hypothetical protein